MAPDGSTKPLITHLVVSCGDSSYSGIWCGCLWLFVIVWIRCRRGYVIGCRCGYVALVGVYVVMCVLVYVSVCVCASMCAAGVVKGMYLDTV